MSTSLPSFLTARHQLTISVNGVLIPFNKTVEAIHRFCRPALFRYEDTPVEISWSGSAFLFRYRGRNFAIFARHQLGEGETAHKQENFSILHEHIDGKRLAITPNSVHRVKFPDEDHKNLSDIFLAEYDTFRHGRDLSRMFLDIDLETNLSTVPHEDVKAIFAIGYPTKSQSLEYTFDEEESSVSESVVNRWVRLYLKLDGPALLDTENRRPMLKDSMANQVLEDPDGMSGSPVFFIAVSRGYMTRLGFAGIITDARQDRFMVYDATVIANIMDSVEP